MNKTIKITLGSIYLIILISFLYFLFSKFDISRIDDFSYYKIIQENIDQTIGNNLVFNLILFFIFSVIWILLLGFGSPLLLLSGILFGKWIGTIISTVSISVGALSLYIVANYFFTDIVNQILKEKFSKYIERFQKNEFYYFFAFRFAGGLGIPFFLQNVLPVIFKMRNTNYFFASLLGFIPGFFIWNTIGAGVNTFIRESNEFSIFNLIFSEEIYIPVIVFIGLILTSLLVKKKYFND
tara:strand:- start:2643 stop:3359 length:717 start_codon:yes stop_codon:yes gene_type:complete